MSDKPTRRYWLERQKGRESMRALEDTIAALGKPVLARSLSGLGKPSAFIARWRHGATVVDIAPSESIRVALSLVEVPNARHRNATGLDNRVHGASISVFSPLEGASLEVTGEADVIQLFLSQASAEAMLDAPFACPPMFDLRDDWIRTMLMRVLVASARGGPDDALMIEEKLLTLALRLERHARRRNQTEKPSMLVRGGLAPAAFRRIEAMIAAALDEVTSPSLAEMADAVGFSVSHFTRAFRQHTGNTPHSHLVRRRMDRAVALLRQPRMSVAEIGDRVGFATPAHFVATFRTAMGVTPGAFRKALAD